MSLIGQSSGRAMVARNFPALAPFKAQRMYTRRQRRLNKRQKMQVKRIVGQHIENKFIDTAASTLTGYTNAGSIGLFTMPANGNTVSARVGDRIEVTKIELNYSCVGYDTTNLFRVIVFKWNNDDSVYAPSVQSILLLADLVQDTAPLARYNWDNMKAGDFNICYDAVHSLSWNNAAASPGSNVIAKRIVLVGKKLHKKRLTLNNGAITGDGRYGIILVTDSGVAGHPKANYTARIHFKDA